MFDLRSEWFTDLGDPSRGVLLNILWAQILKALHESQKQSLIFVLISEYKRTPESAGPGIPDERAYLHGLWSRCHPHHRQPKGVERCSKRQGLSFSFPWELESWCDIVITNILCLIFLADPHVCFYVTRAVWLHFFLQATFLLSVTLSFLLHWVVSFFSSSCASAQSPLPPLYLWASRPQTFVSQSLRFSMHTWVNFSKRSNCACVMKADGSEHCSLQLGWMGRAHRDHTLSQVLRTADQVVGRNWELGESCFTGILCTQHDFCCFMSLWMYYCITGEWWVFSLRK